MKKQQKAENELIIARLEEIYKHLNKTIFKGNLPEYNFLINPKKQPSFRFNSEHIVVGKDITTISFSELLISLLHEMVHIYNYQHGISDCSRNQYHNKHFMEVALRCGLICIKHRNQGWSITTTVFPRNVVDKTAVSLPEKSDLLIRRQAFRGVDSKGYKQFKIILNKLFSAKQPSKTFFLKYVCKCPAPHNSIRSGRRPDGPNPLKIRCLDCGQEFTCENLM